MRWIIAILIAQFLAGCAYGPKAERKFPLNALNGENYETSNVVNTDVLVIPITKRKERITRIKGIVILGEGFSQVSLKNEPVMIYNSDNKLVKTVSTDTTGQFMFADGFKNGRYKIRVGSDKYWGEAPVEISDYEIKDIIILVKPRE